MRCHDALRARTQRTAVLYYRNAGLAIYDLLEGEFELSPALLECGADGADGSGGFFSSWRLQTYNRGGAGGVAADSLSDEGILATEKDRTTEQ